MATISVCIPHWNREDALVRCIASIKNQTFKDCEICIGEHPAISISRNFAARKAKGKYLVFVDSDVVLNPYALEHYHNLFLNNDELLIVGQYHWMPPFYSTKIDGIVGNDPRDFTEKRARSKYCLDFFSGNFGISADLYLRIGEMDEKMTGHGGEDCEFAMRLQKAGHKAVFSTDVVGFHHYHERNQKKNDREVNKNIDYIAKKHDLKALGIIRGKKGQLPLVYV